MIVIVTVMLIVIIIIVMVIVIVLVFLRGLTPTGRHDQRPPALLSMQPPLLWPLRVSSTLTLGSSKPLLHSRKLTWKPKKSPIKTTVLLKGDYIIWVSMLVWGSVS